MRLLELRFKNLNSLAGTWSIDFKNPRYRDDGLFAIVGPTGSGKSTVLDAVCLALYGRTPRLNRLTASENEIMSRRTGECFSQVEFEAGGESYRCVWSQHRSRKSPFGNLQQPVHQLSRSDGEILESSLSRTASVVSELIGLDFDRFTRSVLLAQGGFSAFLDASPGDRAPLLERITGTEIYSRISMAVHERKNAEEDELKKLDESLASLGGDLPSRKETEGRLLSLEWAIDRITAELSDGESRLSLMKEEKKTASEILDLERLMASLEKEGKNRAADLLRLERYRKAQPLMAPYERISFLRGRLSAIEKNLSDIESSIESTSTDMIRYRAESARLSSDKKDSEVRLEGLLPIWRKVREIDSEVRSLSMALAERRDEKSGVDEKISTVESNLIEADRTLSGVMEDRRRWTILLDEISGWDSLIPRLSDLAEKLERIRGLSSELHVVEKNIPIVTSELDGKNREVDSLKISLKVLENQRDRLSRVIDRYARRAERILAGRSVSEWRKIASFFDLATDLFEVRKNLQHLENRTADLVRRLDGDKEQLYVLSEKEELLNALVSSLEKRREDRARTQAMEEQRVFLVEGDPCPLCGSIQHPYASGIPNFQGLDEEWNLRKSDLAKTAKEKTKLEVEVERILSELEKNEKDKVDLVDLIERKESSLLSSASILSVKLPEGEKDVASGKILTERVIGIVERISEVRDIKRADLEQVGSSLNEAETSLHRYELNIAELENRLRGNREDRDRIFRERSSLEISLKPILSSVGLDFSDDLEDAIAKGAERYREIRNAIDSFEERENGLTGRIRELKASFRSLNERADELSCIMGDRNKEISALVAERNSLFSGDPDIAESESESELKELSSKEERVNRLLAVSERQLHLDEERRESLRSEAISTKAKLDSSESFFFRLCENGGFLGEEEFLASLENRDEIEVISRWNEEREDRIRTVALNLSEKREKVKSMGEFYDRDVANVEASIDSLRSERDGKLGEKGRAQSDLDRIDEAEEARNDLSAKRTEQAKVVALWRGLHGLIGSSDGKKFRSFAQGIAFKSLVFLANEELRRMSDRYVLIPKKDEPMEIQVRDSYQAGEIRSTRNLSGGERFLVSLALALGLSAMSSRKVRVDSLFLDEGFGTLDDVALDQALDALSELRQNGKLIGVISHVSAIRERIGTRIKVEPLGGGRSRIVGPGVGCDR